MELGFETDVNNQNFSGARDPDSMLYVEFYMHKPVDWNKSQETGRKVEAETAIPYVRIQQPGDKTSIMETPVRDDHKQRFPKHWLAFQIREGMVGGENIPGWQIDEWEVLNKDQIHELKYLRFHTVEQIAGASDEQVQRLGMGGLGLREQARQALRNKIGAEVKAVMEAKDKELAEMKERMAKLEAALLGKQEAPVQHESLSETVAVPHKRKPGRPKKVVESVG